jgi:hypothetical protein
LAPRVPLIPVPWIVPIPQTPRPLRPVPEMVPPPHPVASTGTAAFARAAQAAWTPPPYYPPLPSAPASSEVDGGGDAVQKILGLVTQSPALGVVAITGLVVMGVVGVVALSQGASE